MLGAVTGIIASRTAVSNAIIHEWPVSMTANTSLLGTNNIVAWPVSTLANTSLLSTNNIVAWPVNAAQSTGLISTGNTVTWPAQVTTGNVPVAPVLNDPYYSSVRWLLHGDGADGSTVLTDSGPLGKTFTRYGTPAVSTAIKKYGTGSMYFDGNGDYFIVTIINGMALQGGDFTIEAWIYPTTINMAGGHTFESNYQSATVGRTLGIVFGKIRFYYRGDSYMDGTTTLSTNTWYHIAVSGTASGTAGQSSVKLFVNGIQEGSTVTAATYLDSSTNNYVGRGAWGGSDFAGYMDDFRVTAAARYTSNFVPPTEAFPDQ